MPSILQSFSSDAAYVIHVDFAHVAITLKSNILSSWGLAAIRSYKAYQDQLSLQLAQTTWTFLNSYMVTPSDAAAGMHPMRSVHISSTCNGGMVTMSHKRQ